MKCIILISMLFVAFVGCAKNPDNIQVAFEWFNLNTNQIWVTNVVGIPKNASPGRLMPSHDENQLEVSSSVFSEIQNVSNRITIEWIDNGQKGWPGGLKTPGGIPDGVSHQVNLQRGDFKIPARLTGGKLRFTYLGDDKWRIKYFP